MGAINMPRLSDSMEEGTIVRWLVDDGAAVTAGQEIVEIETDKATMAYEAEGAGNLRILVKEEEVAAVGAPIAELVSGAIEDHAPPEPGPQPVGEVVVAAEPSSDQALRSPGVSTRDGVKASPVARRAAERLGLDLASVRGSGVNGRILKKDVVAAGERGASTPAVSTPVPRAPGESNLKGEVEVRPLSRHEQTVARRMAESKATAPDFLLTADLDMTAAVAMRGQLKEILDAAPSVNDMIVKAVALALAEHRELNARYVDGTREIFSRINVGVAVAGDGTLMVPTVFDADVRPLGEIAATTRGLAQKARENALTAPELGGGTVTVSNLGMFGIRQFAGVINPPQAMIVSVGAVEERPAAIDGELQIRQLMSATVTCDHRIVYGADGARFLATLRSILEHPLRLMV